MELLKYKDFLEIAYYISGIVLTIVGIIGLTQLWLIFRDSKIRYKRNSIDNSIKVVERYLKSVIKIYDDFYDKRIDKGIPSYDGNIECLSTVDFESKEFQLRCDTEWRILFNELEIVCASILSGTCNEEFAFKSIGLSLVNSIAYNFDLLMWARQGCGNHHYNNTWELFERWRKRVVKLDLEDEKKRLNDELTKITCRKIKEIK